MTGHHIYTRSWYEYGSNSKSPGTFSVELTERIFAPNAAEIIFRELNPKFSSIGPTTAGYSMEQSLLRLFHPTADSVVAARSYFVNDAITGRGLVQYSFSLVFTGEDRDKFLKCPRRAFELSAFEPYEKFKNRVNNDGTIKYSAEYDPKPADYAVPVRIARDTWTDFGFNKEIFIKFFVSLGKAISPQKGGQKVAVRISNKHDGEALILSVLSILPPQLRRKFGAVSRWSGPTDAVAAVSGMQLVCYVDEKPPDDISEAVIDLSANCRHRNIEQITYEQHKFALSYWENIENPEVFDGFTRYLSANFGALSDKMPFTVLAHCFWLWTTFYETGETEQASPRELDFSTASRAIICLMGAFGGNLNEHFNDKNLLAGIFSAYIKGLDTAQISDVKVDLVRAICILAIGNVRVTANNINARELIRPLFTKLYKAGPGWGVRVIMQYYAKIIKDERPADRISEAVALSYAVVASYTDKSIADEVGAALKQLAATSAVKALCGGDDAFRESFFALFRQCEKSLQNVISAALFGAGAMPPGGGKTLSTACINAGLYMILALLLKSAPGHEYIFDAVSHENIEQNPTASKAFYMIEKFNRDYISNIAPPTAAQIDRVAGIIAGVENEERNYVSASLFGAYWAAAEIALPESKEKYINYLIETQKLSMFVKAGAGIDEIRNVYIRRFNSAFDGRTFNSADEFIKTLYGWWIELSEVCAFPRHDLIYDHYIARVEFIHNQNLLLSISPHALKELSELLSRLNCEKYTEFSRAAAYTAKLDGIAAAGGDFSATYSFWNHAIAAFDLRMEYWMARANIITPDMALSKAVISAKGRGLPLNDYRTIAEPFLNIMKSGRSYKNDLENLYGALSVVSRDDRFGADTEPIFVSVKTQIELIIQTLRSERLLETLLQTADNFAEIFPGGVPQNSYVLRAGRMICSNIMEECVLRKLQVPGGVLEKFNPYEKREMPMAGGFWRKCTNILNFKSERSPL